MLEWTTYLSHKEKRRDVLVQGDTRAAKEMPGTHMAAHLLHGEQEGARPIQYIPPYTAAFLSPVTAVQFWIVFPFSSVHQTLVASARV
jgi:hypothetical protein